MLAVTAGMVCGGAVFAAEREAGTIAFLDSLPAAAGTSGARRSWPGSGWPRADRGPRRARRRARPGPHPRLGGGGRRLFAPGVRLGRVRLHHGPDHPRVGRHRDPRRLPDRVLRAHPGHALLPDTRREHAAHERRDPLPRVMFATPLILSAWLFTGLDRTAPPRKRPGYTPRAVELPPWSPRKRELRAQAPVRAPRRSRLGWVALLWLPGRQLLVPGLVTLGVRPRVRPGPPRTARAALPRLAGAGAHGRRPGRGDRLRRRADARDRPGTGGNSGSRSGGSGC